MNLKTKNLVLINGIIGLIGGIILLFGIVFIIGTATATGSGDFSILLLNLIKIAILALGIAGAVYYRGDVRVGAAPAVLMIVGGVVSLIPLLGWIGGILAIIGGSLYLAALKKFNSQA